MKISLITHYYPPEIGAPQARLSEMTDYWSQQGHEITVLTGMPNHPTGVIPNAYRRKIFKKETDGKKNVFRHWLFASPKGGFVNKTLGHLSLMVSVVALSLFRGKRPDIIVVSSPTFFSVFSAYIFSRIRRVPFVFEVRDLWPGVFVELGVLRNRWLIRILESMELFLYRKAAAIVVVTNAFKQDLVRRGVPQAKIHVVTNGANLKFFDDRLEPVRAQQLRKSLQISSEAKIFMYIGAIGISHGLDIIVQAAKRLQNHSPQILVLFVGEGAMKTTLKKLVRHEKIHNVIFHDGVSRDLVPLFYQMADTCFVSLKNIAGFNAFIPSKMFEIMACSKPILGIVSGESKEILEKSGSAEICQPGSFSDVEQAMLKMAHDPLLDERGKLGRSFVEQNYDRNKLAKFYLEILERMSQT